MKDKQWINKGLKKSSKQKINYTKKWLSTKNREDEINYKKYRKRFSQLCRHLYFPVVELYKNFNALPPLKLHEQQIFMLLHKFFHH